MQGNCTDDEVLLSLGVESYDAVVVSIASNMRDSILICMLLKEMRARYIVAKAMDDLHAKVLQKIGVDQVIFPERDMGKRTARSLATGQLLDSMILPDDYEIGEIRVPQEWEDRSLGQIDIRKKYDLSVLSVRRGKEMKVSPRADFVLRRDDVLLVLGQTAQLGEIGRL